MAPFFEGDKAVMASDSNKTVSAADEQRCICIIVDSTSESNRRHTHTLPLSTTTDQLFEVVATKLKYVKTTFSLFLSHTSNNFEMTEENQVLRSQDHTLSDVGFLPGCKTFLNVGPLNGNKPMITQMSSIPESLGDDASTSATEWSYSSRSYSHDSISVAPPPPPPVPPKITRTVDNRRGAVSDPVPTFSESISEAACKLNGSDFKGTDNKGTHLIGLVNQAMTCYLNSLIQTLYMTPEFRNALYEWEYKGTITEAATTIPFQLQRLFLALQTSDKQAVETTDLTKSFGWDSSEAWQQHDIQELCRVMFDALEQKFKESAEDCGKVDEISADNSNHKKSSVKKKEPEIIKLYEGKMKDYVQCEECKNETSRNDTYLDIAIPIRPFGSSVAYRSVLEGLEAFVTPETLDGSNQYFCEKCNKKCDAKKGLKFTSFPYLLTLQLKRFDFDYNTLHRVKLNDRMYFPEMLDLNSFIEEEIDKVIQKDQISDEASDYSGELDGNEGAEEIETSSHDSGNDDDRLAVRRGKAHMPGNMANVSDSEGGSSIDEGIEIETRSEQSGAIGGAPIEDVVGDSSVSGPVGAEAMANASIEECCTGGNKKGKYVYELFSIMIHSGSAVGGHYYAYIKSFDDGQWYSFNDQIVSPISTEDIEKSYGGSGSFTTFSSSYSSSTNAYMLMYRQIDPSQNKAFIKTEELPPHIERLIHEEEEMKAKMEERREKEKNMCSIKVYCRHLPLIEKKDAPIAEESFEFHNSLTLREATEEAYKLLKLDECNVSLSNCRLVKYDHYHQSLERSLDDEPENQDEPLAQLLGGSRMSYLIDLLMETKENHERFDIYPTGGVTIKVFPADYQKGCFHHQVIARLMPTDTIHHLKQVLSKRLHYPLRRIRMAMEKFAGEMQFLTCATQSIRDTGVYRMMKIYVDLMNDEECEAMEQICEDSSTKYSTRQIDVKDTRLGLLIERTANLITVEIELPEDAPQYVLPPSRPMTPTIQEAPSPVGSLPPLIDESLLMEVEHCPKPPPGSARSTPSIDEGVGSYDGSSGSNSVPKTAECSACASPRDRIQPADDLIANSSISLQPDGESPNWQADEAAYDQSDDGTVDANLDTGSINYEPLSQSPVRRNSEEDKSSPGMLSCNISHFEDFEKLLGSKLSAAAINQSPTSSLRCEGGSSDSASETSGEFEIHEYARQQGDGAADSAGSCSTIDSTGTLCNNPDDQPMKDAYLPLSPTIIDPLPRVNNTSLHNQSSESDDKTRKNCYLEGPVNEEARGSNADYCSCLSEHSTNETSKNWSLRSDFDSGPGYLCAKCGRMKPSCINDETKITSSSIETKGSTFDPLINNQDPESGEDVDNIQPLFSEIGSKDFGAAGDSMCGGKTKYLELSSLERPVVGSNVRRRTESSSSVMSDLGYGDQNHMQHVYFRVMSVSSNERKCQVLKAQLDKRMSVGALKHQIQPNLRIHTRNFSIYRVLQSGQESELNTLNETFSTVSSDASLRIKNQRALRKDEYRCKIFQLNTANDDHVKHLVDWVMKKGLTIKDAKREICDILERECSLNVKPELIRLRKKKVRNPGKIFLDSDTFGSEVMMSLNPEIFLEILKEPMEKEDSNQISIFCRRWRPSSLTLDAMEEVFVTGEHFCRNYAVQSLKTELSRKSGLEASDIEWAKPKGVFPCLTNVLEIHDGLTWDPHFTTYLDYSPANISEDGSLIFYRDKNEVLKTLSDEEKTDIRQKEEKRLAVAMGSSSSSSRGSSVRPYQRREKALKIYTVPSSSFKK